MILTIFPNGRLIKTKDSGTAEDVTNKIPFYTQYYECKIAKGVTLKDILLLIQRDLDFWKILVNNYVETFVEEGLRETNKTADLDYLELYYWLQVEDDTVLGLMFPDFHGHKDNTSYALDFLPVYEIADLPVVLGGFKACGKVYQSQYTLNDIVAGIIWELSFYGPPEQRDEQSKILCDRYDEIIEREVKGE
jgi:hypothetical protein